jgi:hypothetical protein
MKQLRLLVIQWEYESSPAVSGTFSQKQYAYFIDDETGNVIKKEVNSITTKEGKKE